MAAKVTLQKTNVNVVFNDGTTASGVKKIFSQPLGRISTENFDADKAMAVAKLLAPCISLTFSGVAKFDSSAITEEA